MRCGAASVQGVLGKVVHSRAAASGADLPPDDAFALLETVLFVAARTADKRAAAAASSGFRYLLAVAQAGGEGTPAQAAPTTALSRRLRHLRNEQQERHRLYHLHCASVQSRAASTSCFRHITGSGGTAGGARHAGGAG